VVDLCGSHDLRFDFGLRVICWWKCRAAAAAILRAECFASEHSSTEIMCYF
jgi:hypothetical protein